MENISNFLVQKGTQEEYDNLEEKSASTLYIITDTKRMYLGDDLYNELSSIDTSSFYNSQYNGFLIKKTFNSVAEMETAFAGGDNYTQVSYGDYVAISVPLNDPTAYSQDNGKIYRRALDGSAEFIMQFTGPAGQPSILEFNTIQQVATTAETDSITPIEKTLSIATQSLVPGKTTEEETDVFNDNVKLSYYHKIENSQDKLHIGMKIPYPTFEIETEVLGANELPNVVDESYTNGVKDHPFHNKLKFQLPQTAHGDSIRNLRIITASANDGVDYGDLDALIIADYRDRNAPILIYDRVTYDIYNNSQESQGETVIPTFVTEFKLIDNIDISEEGYLRFWLTNSDNNTITISSSTSVVPNITNFTLSQNGQLTIVWEDFQGNQISKTLDTHLRWIKNLSYNDDGTLNIIWNTVDQNEAQETASIQTPTFITDLIVYNMGLYKSFIGINNEIKLITELTDAELTEANDAAVNSRAGSISTYHKEIKGDKQVWYKKIFDFNLLSNSSNISNNNG